MTFLDIISTDWNPLNAYDKILEDPQAFVQLEKVIFNKKQELEANIDGSTVLQVYRGWVKKHKDDLEGLKRFEHLDRGRANAEQKLKSWSDRKTYGEVEEAQKTMIIKVISERLEVEPLNRSDIKQIRERLFDAAKNYAEIHYDAFEPYWPDNTIESLINPNVETNFAHLKRLIEQNPKSTDSSHFSLQHQCHLISSNIRRLATCMGISSGIGDDDQTIVVKIKIQLSSKEVTMLQNKVHLAEKLAAQVIFRACVEKVASYHKQKKGDTTTLAWERAVINDFASSYQDVKMKVDKKKEANWKGLFAELSADIHYPSNGKIEIQTAHLRGVHVDMFQEIIKKLKAYGDMSWEIDFI